MKGLEIKEKRKKLNLTQEELGKLMGVTKKTILNYESGEVVPQSKREILHQVLNSPTDIKDIERKKSIPLIPIDAMAGFGEGETQIMEFESETFIIPTFKDAEFLISVKGSSMYPKYNSGDIVACKKLALGDLFFQWNKVYVLDTKQGALIKRIKKGSDLKSVLLVSDNESYDPFELKITQINSVALVIGVIRLE